MRLGSRFNHSRAGMDCSWNPPLTEFIRANLQEVPPLRVGSQQFWGEEVLAYSPAPPGVVPRTSTCFSLCWRCISDLVYTVPKPALEPRRPTGPSVSQNSSSLMQLRFQTTPLPCYSNTKRHKFRVWVLLYNKNILLQFFSANHV